MLSRLVLTFFFLCGVAVLSGVPASAALILNPSEGVISGSQIVVEGSLADFPDPNGRYSATGVTGTDRFATISNPYASGAAGTDFFVQFGAASLPAIDVGVYRYAEVSYSLSDNFAGDGTTHALRLDTTIDPAAFVLFANRGVIGSTAGAHSFIIDLQQGTDLSTAAGIQYSGNLTTFRWDFFNGAPGNEGKTFTLDKVTFASNVTAVPEPSSMMLVGLAVTGVIACRRRAMNRV